LKKKSCNKIQFTPTTTEKPYIAEYALNISNQAIGQSYITSLSLESGLPTSPYKKKAQMNKGQAPFDNCSSNPIITIKYTGTAK
jgi:hypothetical protein